MLFLGEEVFKKVLVLLGGEKVCCMLFKIMFIYFNFIFMDELINYFDLEFIMVFNNVMIDFKGNMIFIFYDYKLMEIVVNCIIEIIFNGIIDSLMNFDDYLWLDVIYV